MILWIDLSILAGVSIWLGTRELFLGIAVFVLGFLFEFQLRRTRLLLGFTEKKVPLLSKIRSSVLALLMVVFLLPALIGERPRLDVKTVAEGQDWALPVVVLLGFLCAMLMVALGVERRRR
ncbi:MAG: hypothetical protein KGP28_02065 [Bdellovibrionales bacterium]|nr:hypothetical protein [Bdellovibrionales bacterium]